MFVRFVKQGRLHVVMPDGTRRTYGEAEARPITISITDRKTVRSLCLGPTLALGEAYTDKKLVIEDDRLREFLDLILKNLVHGSEIPAIRFSHRIRKLHKWFTQYNPAKRARANVKHHYDLSDRLYELFLDSDRQYSCAYFKSPDDTIDQAQLQKKHHIARKLLLSPGRTVLDIGCGWGGLGLYLAEEYDARVYGVTLSSGQHRVANERAERRGLKDKAEFHLRDYRKVNSKFDRIVSVGMFEHVGVPHYREFFRKLSEFLKDDGVALLHTIGRFDGPGTNNPWINKYIFPGAYTPAMSEVLSAIELEGLVVTDIEVLRLHYAATLRRWYDNFMANIDEILEEYDERFCRMWRFYLASCEMGFRYNQMVVFQFQLAKDQASVPLIRDYLYTHNEEPPERLPL